MSDAATTVDVARKTAANGLRLVAERLAGVRSVTVTAWCRAGMADETPARQGLSHVVEHMSFKGTARRTAAQLAEEVDGVGGALGGFTDTENVAFSVRVLDENLPLALDVLSDLILGPADRPEELAKEKNVIAEEIRLYEDMPHDKVHDLVAMRLEPGRALGMPVLGTQETVAAVTRDDVQGYRRRNFTADRIVVSAAGHLEPAAFLDAAASYFEAASSGDGRPAEENRWPEAPPFVVKDTEQTHLCLGVPALPFDHADRYVLAVLTTLWGGTISSRLFRAIREDRGLAYDVYAFDHAFHTTGHVIAYAGTSPANAAATRDLIRAQMAELAQAPPSAAELRRTQDYLKGSMMLGLEATSARAMRNARNQVYLGRYVSLEEILAGVEAVTADDCRRLAGVLFGAPPVVVAIGPNAEDVATH